MYRRDDPTDPFKHALTQATRSLAENPEVEVSFSTDPPTIQGTEIRLPLPSRDLDSEEVARIRGQADAFALHLSHHDEETNKRYQPVGSNARAIFSALEQARIESIGANTMKGVRENLGAMLEHRYAQKGLAHIEDRQEAPVEDIVALLARERLTGLKPPPSARRLVKKIRPLIEEKANETLDSLSEHIYDQTQYARVARKLIADLDFADELGDDPDQMSRDSDDNQESDSNSDPEEMASDAHQPEGANAEQVEAPEGDDSGDDDQSVEVKSDDAASTSDTDELTDGNKPWRPENYRGKDSDRLAYRVYSSIEDETVNAEELCDAEELIRLRRYLEQQLRPLQSAVGRLANRLQRKLMAQQNRWWEFDQEEGLLDSARLTRVVTDPLYPLSFKVEQDTDFRDTIVTLLLDNSGSMRGRPITVASMCADILARTLERCSVKVEILGFTTKAWKGGASREKWLADGKPANPGRLNDLRHIIYKKADAPWRRTRKNLGLMMREGLLKENIDGEALLWAHRRLLGRPEERRVLMVISDGAPVDDSTLSVNAGNYLERHLREVIDYIETSSPVELIAIGIGHDVTRYYKRAVTIVDAEQLGGAMTEQLASLFERGNPATHRRIRQNVTATDSLRDRDAKFLRLK